MYFIYVTNVRGKNIFKKAKLIVRSNGSLENCQWLNQVSLVVGSWITCWLLSPLVEFLCLWWCHGRTPPLHLHHRQQYCPVQRYNILSVLPFLPKLSYNRDSITKTQGFLSDQTMICSCDKYYFLMLYNIKILRHFYKTLYI